MSTRSRQKIKAPVPGQSVLEQYTDYCPGNFNGNDTEFEKFTPKEEPKLIEGVMYMTLQGESMIVVNGELVPMTEDNCPAIMKPFFRQKEEKAPWEDDYERAMKVI